MIASRCAANAFTRWERGGGYTRTRGTGAGREERSELELRAVHRNLDGLPLEVARRRVDLARERDDKGGRADLGFRAFDDDALWSRWRKGSGREQKKSVSVR
jgi:hypothetical protein